MAYGKFVAVVLAAGLLVAGAGSARATAYDFDFGGSNAKSTPASITTLSGLGVTFTSPTAPHEFLVADTAGVFMTFSGKALFDQGTGGDVLNLAFDAPVTELTFKFGLDDFSGAAFKGADTLTVTINGVPVTVTATVPAGGFFPEAFADVVVSGGFTSASITSAYDFAIGLHDVPEPASAALLGSMLLSAGLLRRRQRNS